MKWALSEQSVGEVSGTDDEWNVVNGEIVGEVTLSEKVSGEMDTLKGQQ